MPITSVCQELLTMANDNSFDYNLKSIDCTCGNIATPTFIDKKYRFEGKVITVKNVPILKCKLCNELYTDIIIDARVEQQAYNAMQENKNEIDFSGYALD
jgi:YgiT-type zinc finger domain-containing protein